MQSTEAQLKKRIKNITKFIEKTALSNLKFGEKVDLEDMLNILSSSAITGFKELAYYEGIFEESKKFRELFLRNAIELIFTEFENFSGKDVQWVRDAVDKKFGYTISNTRFIEACMGQAGELEKVYLVDESRSVKKLKENLLYGMIVIELIELGSTKNNSIEFISAVSGITKTVVRDSYYEVFRIKEKYGRVALDRYYFGTINRFMEKNIKTFLLVAKNKRFIKSSEALSKLISLQEKTKNNDKAILEAVKEKIIEQNYSA